MGGAAAVNNKIHFLRSEVHSWSIFRWLLTNLRWLKLPLGKVESSERICELKHESNFTDFFPAIWSICTRVL
jgi:hypothetical protein